MGRPRAAWPSRSQTASSCRSSLPASVSSSATSPRSMRKLTWSGCWRPRMGSPGARLPAGREDAIQIGSPMFESLSARLQSVAAGLRGKARVTEADLDAALRDIRLALLEADVNFRVVKDFVAKV